MTVILYNPKAHNGRGKDQATEWAQAHGYDTAEMQSVLDIPNLAAYAYGMTENDKLIISGGDGTLTRFADAVRDILLTVPVYFTASGTGNDFLRDVAPDCGDEPVQINKYIENLPRVFVNGEEHVFINGIGYGLDGYCCEVGDRLQANSDKPVNYTKIAIGGLLGKFKLYNAEITVDGVTESYRRVWLSPAMNGRFYGGGLMITPDQDRLNEDGTLSTLVFHDSGRLKTLLIFSSISKGGHTGHTDVIRIRRGHEITVRFDRPCALQIDGETYLGVTEYTVRGRKPAAEWAAYVEGKKKETAQRVVAEV